MSIVKPAKAAKVISVPASLRPQFQAAHYRPRLSRFRLMGLAEGPMAMCVLVVDLETAVRPMDGADQVLDIAERVVSLSLGPVLRKVPSLP
jgi:hypothetical protein